MTATEYIPQFDDTVVEYSGDGKTAYPINPRCCLTVPSAKLMATLFSPAPALFMAPPISQAMGSPFKFNHNVPWLKFTNGTVRNAADLAQYWGMPGVPLSQVMVYVQADIDTPVEGQ